MQSEQVIEPSEPERRGRLARSEHSRTEALVKRVLDVLLSALLLLALLPLLIGLACAVRLTSGGGVLYSQLRVGREGRPFRFYKFRTMRCNAEELLASFLEQSPEASAEWREFQKLSNDPRITPIGAFLRRTSLDELPQLWNVLKGDMSIVGPRPCMQSQIELYGTSWAAYCAVRPGITGLWQVSGRNKLTFAQRVRLDEEYVRNACFKKDMWILARTLKVVIQGEGSQ